MDQTFLLQLNRWNEEEEYQKIIEAVEALPEEEKTPVLISEMACAYNNLAEADDSRLFEKASCWNRWKRSFRPITDGISAWDMPVII